MQSVPHHFSTTSGCTKHCCPSACKSSLTTGSKLHSTPVMPSCHCHDTTGCTVCRMLRQLSARGWGPCGRRGVSGLHMYTTVAAQKQEGSVSFNITHPQTVSNPWYIYSTRAYIFLSPTLSVSLFQVPLMQHAYCWRVQLATGTQHAKNLHQCMSTESLPHQLHSRLASTPSRWFGPCSTDAVLVAPAYTK